MKTVIRHGVFETNSSSTHSVSIRDDGKMYEDTVFDVLSDNKVHASFGEFGWEQCSYTDPHTKLSYALTMVLETERTTCEDEEVKSKEDFYKTEGFKMINDLISEKCHCDGVEIDDSMVWTNYTYEGCDPDDGYLKVDGYIDHQSCEDYSSLQDFLNDYNTTLEDFIFNSGVKLITDNDNH